MNAANNNLNGRGALDEFKIWFESIPLVTRVLFASSLGLSLGVGMGIGKPISFVLLAPRIYPGLELWRLVTCFLWSPLQYGYLMLLYFLYNYSWQLETSSQFSGRKADYLFFVLFSMVVILPVGIYMNQFLLLESLVVSMLYVWSMNNQEQEVSFFFGLRFKAMFLPWVYIIFDFLTGAPFPPIPKLIGIFAGHLYYFLDTIYPQHNNGVKLLSTPGFLYSLVGEDPNARGIGGVAGTGAPGMSGRGQRLGGAPAAAGAGGIGGWFNRNVATPRPAANGAGPGNQGASASAGVRQRTGYTWGSGGQRLGSE